jgi:hypothetical protein
MIYLNSFNNNNMNAFEKGNNFWYNPTLKLGNYWDDYQEIDEDLDGIGDFFYTKGGVRDIYPLGIFLKPPSKPSNPSPEDGEDAVGLKITLSVKVEDPDEDIMDVYFYRVTNESLEDSLIDVDNNVFSGDTATCTFNLDFDTTFFWYAIADDRKLVNKSNLWYFSTRIRPASNLPPIAVASGPYGADIGELITFDASSSYDPDGTIEFYRWNFGDGTSEILSVTPKHAYYGYEKYNAILTVIDDFGTSSMTTVEVDISPSSSRNQPPVADAGGPYSSKTGTTIIFDGSVSSDDKNITEYFWDFGDGTTSTTENPSHSYSKSNNYTISLQVKDEEGETNIDYTYALVKKSSTDETPGFEIIITLFSLAIFIIFKRRKK